MARKIFFAAIIILLAAFFFLYTTYIERSCETIIIECDLSIEAVKNNDFEEAQRSVATLLKTWKDYSPHLEILISNNTIDTIHLMLEKINVMLEVENRDIALEHLVDIRNIFVDLPQKEHLNWGNIF